MSGAKRFSIFVLTAFVLLAAGCSTEEVGPSPEPTARPVRYVRVESTTGGRARTFSGVSQAGVQTNLSFRVPGRVSGLTLKVGDLVQAGQFIAELDPRDYQVQVETAQAAVTEARAMLLNAEADYQRIRGLYERDNASQGEYDAAVAQRDSARARVQSAEKQVEYAQLQLSYTRLTTSIDAAVVETPVENNENVQAGQAIVRLNAGDYPEVVVGIPELLIAEIERNQAATIVFDSAPDRQFRGTVAELAVTATPGLTTYPVTIRFNRTWQEITGRDGELAEIRPGMAVEATFRFPAPGGERFLVPTTAVGADGSGRFVYVVNETSGGKGTVARRPVQVGELVSGGLEITSGLRNGEMVVTAGVTRIADGQEVRLLSQFEG